VERGSDRRRVGEMTWRLTPWKPASPAGAGVTGGGESDGGVLRLLRRNGDAGGDSRPLGLIPWTRRIRERRRSSWRLRLRPGRRETEGLDGGHGGDLGYARGREAERERAKEKGNREGKKRGGRRREALSSQGRAAVRIAAASGDGGQATELLAVYREDRKILQKCPRFFWVFLETLKQHLFLQIL
jgi:hypothetical protein